MEILQKMTNSATPLEFPWPAENCGPYWSGLVRSVGFITFNKSKKISKKQTQFNVEISTARSRMIRTTCNLLWCSVMYETAERSTSGARTYHDHRHISCLWKLDTTTFNPDRHCWLSTYNKRIASLEINVRCYFSAKFSPFKMVASLA